MTLQEMRKELRERYERLLRRERARVKTMIKYYEPILSKQLSPSRERKFLVKCKRCGRRCGTEICTIT